MRKVLVKTEIMLEIVIDEGQEVSNVIDEMDYSFEDTTGNADIVNTEIMDYEIIDSK